MKSYAYGYASAGWRDRLISFDGQTITYDAIGNPTTYRGNTLTWTNVRRLASYGSHTFSYGADGIRYKKDSTTYTLDGSTILKETNGTRTITYYYGANGVVGFQYNGTNYYYQKNLQGDVTAIYNADGTCAATYTYDAWGKVLSVTNCTTANIGTLNPFRYRSYYYDVETNLYYLETRYYDPETGRFINSDSLSYLGDGNELSNYNLFAYCGNNPIMGYDPEGTFSWKTVGCIALGFIAIAVTAIAVACTAGAAAGIVLGLADATVGTLVKAGIVAGIATGGFELGCQTIAHELNGTEFDYGAVVNATAIGTLDRMAHKILLGNRTYIFGNPKPTKTTINKVVTCVNMLGRLADRHSFAYDILKSTFVWAGKSIWDAAHGEDMEKANRENFGDFLNNILQPIAEKAWEILGKIASE